MKITLSKSQWEGIGRKAGWIRTAQLWEEKEYPHIGMPGSLERVKLQYPKLIAKLNEMKANGSGLSDAFRFIFEQIGMNDKSLPAQSLIAASDFKQAGEVIKEPTNDNSLRAKSQKWWSSLSINQMKELTRKYHPNPHITWAFISDTPGLVEDIYQKENAGITLSKSQREGIGKKAGWMKTAKTHDEIAQNARPARPCNSNDLILVDEGLQCGNCLAITRDHGKTWESANKVNVGKSIDIFQLVEDWGDQGYGIALISADGVILDAYIDPSDYPDMILNKSGNGAKVIGGKNTGCMIMFHSGQLEGKVGQDWYDSTLGKNKKHLGEDTVRV